MKNKKTALLAFGGNALLQANERGFQEEQIENAKACAELCAKVISQGYNVLVVHGNGPQVGNILLQQEAASGQIPPYTLDICVAQTEGSMGYMLERCIANILTAEGLDHDLVTILTEIVVDAKDPAFEHPTKPIGPFYPTFRAEELIRSHNWHMVEDSGRGWRKVVPSPKPLEVVQEKTIKTLLDNDTIVIAAGGGGIPVIKDPRGMLMGVEVVIDKDRASALLAGNLEMDMFVLLTGVEKVAINFGTPEEKWLDTITTSQAEQLLKEGHFPPGSMGPKIESAIDYLHRGGQEVLITSPSALLSGNITTIGTRIIRG